MLMTPITPNVMARPMAASSSTEPSESPYQAFCTVLHSASRLSIDAIASAAARCTSCGCPAGRPASRPRASWSARSRITVTAASLSFSLASAWNRMTAARASVERALDAAVGFLGERGIERRQRVRVARLEHRLRGFVALGRIGGEQRQAAERGLDRAAQAVVEPHRSSGRPGGDAAGLPVAASSTAPALSRMKTLSPENAEAAVLQRLRSRRARAGCRSRRPRRSRCRYR